METARFLITLTRTQDHACRVERKVKRSDQNRAVFYACQWLLQTQRLEHYFGVTYNVYEIYKQNDAGEWVRVETGGVSDAETRRTETRPEAAKSKTPSVDTKSSAAKSRKGRSARDDVDDPFFVTDKIRGPSQRFRRSQTLSPFQQRVKAELELARQQLADRKAKGAE